MDVIQEEVRHPAEPEFAPVGYDNRPRVDGVIGLINHKQSIAAHERSNVFFRFWTFTQNVAYPMNEKVTGGSSVRLDRGLREKHNSVTGPATLGASQLFPRRSLNRQVE
ncbi:hypothetical protein [Pilimelia anulata]|uniref:hypothetical protein n=1 Tax=Pilimelia anulata TaxID=53371 RepID=UPI0016637AA3|nr:hypothetical protein [Pilimelia anulata]